MVGQNGMMVVAAAAASLVGRFSMFCFWPEKKYVLTGFPIVHVKVVV